MSFWLEQFNNKQFVCSICVECCAFIFMVLNNKIDYFLQFYAMVMTIEHVKKIKCFSIILCKTEPMCDFCQTNRNCCTMSLSLLLSHVLRDHSALFASHLSFLFFSPNQYEFALFYIIWSNLSLPWAVFNLRLLNQLHCTFKGIYDNRSSSFCLSSVYISTVRLCLCKVFFV